ncbi:glycoside hydrolase family 65 protein [Candidatus Omnitrophota bacterium]
MVKDFYSSYTNEELWLIKETEWVKKLQNIRESQFSLSNGYLGARASLEESPQGCWPGLYIAGLYDNMGSQVDELVNLPSPMNFKFTIEGHKLDVVAMDLLSHKRVLNMRKGLLIRQDIYRDRKKRRYDYQSLMFLSMKNKNIGVMQIIVTPLDDDCTVDINTGIDTAVYNAPVISEGTKKKHFRIRELGQQDKAGYLVIETLEKKHSIAYWSGFYYEQNRKRVFAKDNVFKLSLKKNKPTIFTKVFHIKRFPCQEGKRANVKLRTHKQFMLYFKGDFKRILKEHIDSWHKLWSRADIIISGTSNLQQNLRFNIYHMLTVAARDNGFSSIGARTLSGEGYRGHIFWDGEIFLMPFYLFTLPEVAKNMLLYRYRRLDASRQLAKEEAYKGAKFAWESASTGEDNTPAWARDINGKITRVHTHEFEHHITADVAYAFYKYYVVTKDEKFFRDYGYEVMFETARFWASRVKYNKRTSKYSILNVIGPDEFHVNVNNNAFTNMMAKWNLIIAYKLFYKIKKDKSFYNKIKNKLSLSDKEAAEWKRISSSIVFNITKDNIIEQFDGYLKLKKVIPTSKDENGMPIISGKLGSRDIEKTQLVKQADVLMLIYLLDDVFTSKTKINNYRFYVDRTLHSSSLSPSMHSICACDVGDMQRAYSFFNVALRMDISNLFRNTKEGMHAASLGGVWQAVIFGFCGVRIRKEKLTINPILPYSWREVIFSLIFEGVSVHFKVTNNTIKIKVAAQRKAPLKIAVFNKFVQIKTGKWHIFKRKSARISLEHVYY